MKKLYLVHVETAADIWMEVEAVSKVAAKELAVNLKGHFYPEDISLAEPAQIMSISEIV